MAEKTKPSAELRECHICGSDVEEDAKYCPECGADFTSDFQYDY